MSVSYALTSNFSWHFGHVTRSLPLPRGTRTFWPQWVHLTCLYCLASAAAALGFCSHGRAGPMALRKAAFSREREPRFFDWMRKPA